MSGKHITRIDLGEVNGGKKVIVNKYAAGWTIGSFPVEHKENTEMA